MLPSLPASQPAARGRRRSVDTLSMPPSNTTYGARRSSVGSVCPPNLSEAPSSNNAKLPSLKRTEGNPAVHSNLPPLDFDWRSPIVQAWKGTISQSISSSVPWRQMLSGLFSGDEPLGQVEALERDEDQATPPVVAGENIERGTVVVRKGRQRRRSSLSHLIVDNCKAIDDLQSQRSNQAGNDDALHKSSTDDQ